LQEYLPTAQMDRITMLLDDKKSYVSSTCKTRQKHGLISRPNYSNRRTKLMPFPA